MAYFIYHTGADSEENYSNLLLDGYFHFWGNIGNVLVNVALRVSPNQSLIASSLGNVSARGAKSHDLLFGCKQACAEIQKKKHPGSWIRDTGSWILLSFSSEMLEVLDHVRGSSSRDLADLRSSTTVPQHLEDYYIQ